jgi:hypothetical protein
MSSLQKSKSDLILSDEYPSFSPITRHTLDDFFYKIMETQFKIIEKRSIDNDKLTTEEFLDKMNFFHDARASLWKSYKYMLLKVNGAINHMDGLLSQVFTWFYQSNPDYDIKYKECLKILQDAKCMSTSSSKRELISASIDHVFYNK